MMSLLLSWVARRIRSKLLILLANQDNVMNQLLLGLVLFFGIHSISIVALPLRDRLAAKRNDLEALAKQLCVI